MNPENINSDPLKKSAASKKWTVFILVAVSIFMSTLDSSIVNVALPYMMQDLGTNINTIQWIVLIYLTTVSSLLLTFGRLSDIKGRKPLYISGFTIFVMGSFLCGIAETPLGLICARAIQGVGASMLMACSPALIVDAFPVKERGGALGLIGAVVAAGLTVGPVAGGFLLEYFSWRYIFYINIPIGMAASFGALIFLPPKAANPLKQVAEPMDIWGSLLLIVVFSSLISWLTQIVEQGVFSFFCLSTMFLFLFSGVLFIRVENRLNYPLFDFGLLKLRLFFFPVLSSAILFAALFVIIFMMPFYLTYACGFSASRTGMIMIVPFLFLLFVSPISGAMYDRWGSRRLCLTGMGGIALSLLTLTALSPDMGLWSILWRIALAGIGTALFISPNNTAIMNSVNISHRGIASGTVALARNIGMVVGVALAGLVFTSSFVSMTSGVTLEQYTPELRSSFMLAFDRTMAMGACLAFTGLVVTFARGKEPRV